MRRDISRDSERKRGGEEFGRGCELDGRCGKFWRRTVGPWS